MSVGKKNPIVRNVSQVDFVKGRILDLIHQQGLRPGDRLISESRLAAQLGAGPVTVHKAFRALAEAGMVVRYPNRKGTFVKGAVIQTIGILGWRDERKFFSDPYYGRVMAGVSDFLHTQRISFLFKTIDARSIWAELFADVPVSGILAIGSSICRYCLSDLQKLARRYPLVVIGATPHDSGLNSISSDYFADARNGVERLIRAGHQRIAVFSSIALPERLGGFMTAMKSARIVPDKRLIFTSSQNENIDMAVKIMRELHPTAIFDACGFVAPRVLPALLTTGANPEILAYDDFRDELRHFPVKSTVIRQPMELIGNTAAQQLLDIIHSKTKSPSRIVLRSEFVNVGKDNTSVLAGV